MIKTKRNKRYSIEPKYFKIAELLRDRINEGAYVEKLPAERELSEQFLVNSKTLKKAINLLAEEGLIYSKHGSGTYISSPVHAPPALIGCLMIAHGHLFEELSKAISINLQKCGFLSTVIDTGDESFGEVGPLNLNRLLSLNPHGLIVDGANTKVMEMLGMHEYRRRVKNLVLALNLAHQAPEWADCVVSDAFYGKYTATKYLLDRGRERILYVDPSVSYEDVVNFPDSNYNQMRKGFEEALRETNNERRYAYASEGELHQESQLLEIIKTKKIDAVLAYNDACALRLIRQFERLGLKVPEDIAVVGYYNTPWTTLMEPRITSVSIREQEIAATCVARITKDRTKGETIKIKPEIIPRQTA